MKRWLALQKMLSPSSWETKTLYTAAVIALIPIGLSHFRSEPVAGSSDSRQRVTSADTHIPRGFVLVPIEIMNQEALDSLLGAYGYVDLYQSSNEGAPQSLVAKNVRILRAPQNPSQFAVLVRESETSHLLAHGGRFTVTLKRPENATTNFVQRQKPKSRKIIYGETE